MLIGGSHALHFHAGFTRTRRDLDVMIRPQHWPWAEQTLHAANVECRLKFPHWLGKARCGDIVVDLIFNSGNGVARVDDDWFAHARLTRMFDMDVLISPPEELLWSKAFVMERERFDGADVLHLLAAKAESLDWPRVLRRFRGHEPVLLAHLVLFPYVYPGRAETLPAWLVPELQHRAEQAGPLDNPRLCRGPLLSRAQYLTDLAQGGLTDGRRWPHGSMTDDDIDCWTRAIDEDERIDTVCEPKPNLRARH
jgi:hypothetical protein